MKINKMPRSRRRDGLAGLAFCSGSAGCWLHNFLRPAVCDTFISAIGAARNTAATNVRENKVSQYIINNAVPGGTSSDGQCQTKCFAGIPKHFGLRLAQGTLALTLGIAGSILMSNKCSAATTASLTITSGGTNQGISITDNITATPGTTAYSKEYIVNVNASSIESYTLKISGPTNLSGPTGSTAIGGANNKTPANMTNNTWGYGWGTTNTAKESLAYQSLSASGVSLSGDAVSSNSVNSSRKLVFAAKFADTNANAGHYTASVNLSLVATPAVLTAKWSNGIDSGINYMQEITTGTSTTSFCKSTLPNLASITLKDKRDENSYTIVKMGDGKCWMTQNLALSAPAGGRILKSSDSDVTTDWTMPATITTLNNATDPKDFSSNKGYHIAESYVTTPNSTIGLTGYYSFTAATAGTGNSSLTTQGANAGSSICPKNWRLPTGLVVGNNTTNDFHSLFNSMDKSIFQNSTLVSANSNGGYTNWAEPKADSLAKVTGSPYNFGLAGYVGNGSLNYVSSYGYWWSSTVSDSNDSYYLNLNSSVVYPGTINNGRYFGFAVRCLAR